MNNQDGAFPSGRAATPEGAQPPSASSCQHGIPNAADGGRNGFYAGDPQYASRYYARWPSDRITFANPAPDASPSPVTTGAFYRDSISAADRFPKVMTVIDPGVLARRLDEMIANPNWRRFILDKDGAELCAAALRALVASGTEAQRATTENTGVVHDGPTAESGDAR